MQVVTIYSKSCHILFQKLSQFIPNIPCTCLHFQTRIKHKLSSLFTITLSSLLSRIFLSKKFPWEALSSDTFNVGYLAQHNPYNPQYFYLSYFNPLHEDALCKHRVKIFQLFLKKIFKIQIFITVFGFSVKNAIK